MERRGGRRQLRKHRWTLPYTRLHTLAGTYTVTASVNGSYHGECSAEFTITVRRASQAHPKPMRQSSTCQARTRMCPQTPTARHMRCSHRRDH